MTVPIEAPQRVIASITRHPETEAFQEAAAQGRFVVPQCGACGRFHWHPRPLCPFCFSDEVIWRDSTGRGTVYTYTVMRRAKPVYAIAYVQLDEGPIMMTNIVGCDFNALKIGMPVRAVFQASESGPLVPMFSPAD
jgi:uncharacterized OB-fold protein